MRAANFNGNLRAGAGSAAQRNRAGPDGPAGGAAAGEAMSPNTLLAPYFARVEACAGLRWQGRVTQGAGPLVESEGPFCSVGEVCQITDSQGRVLAGEIVGFRDTTVLSMPLESPRGIRYGGRGSTWGERQTDCVGDRTLGGVCYRLG